MGLTLTGAQLDAIASELFICRDLHSTRLPIVVTTTGALALADKLDWIAQDPTYRDLSIGIMDVTDLNAPMVWTNNSWLVWRLASTAKLALILAAVQLRDDVRWLYKQGYITTGDEGDELFAMPELWRRARTPMARRLADTTRPPRISTIFDFGDPHGPEFNGGFIQYRPVDVAVGQPFKGGHVRRPSITALTFADRLWNAGVLSDNIAAASCISEIGLAYMKAVLVTYGLHDSDRGMHFLLASSYKPIDTRIDVRSDMRGVKYRSLDTKDVETDWVIDPLRDAQGRFTNISSSEAGNVDALLVFMLAWRREQLASSHLFNTGSDAQLLIQNCLADGAKTGAQSRVIEGMPPERVALQFEKIGLLDTSDGEAAYLNSEFAYVELEKTPGHVRRLGIAVAGIRPPKSGLDAVSMTRALGAQIFQSLM